MTELLGVVGVAVGLFATTNIDDIVILVAYFSDRRIGRRKVIAGQFLGIGALVGASALLGTTIGALPGPWVGLLGIVPLALGVRALRDARRGRADADTVEPPPVGRSAVLAVAGVTIANGGDNLGVYVPVFAVLDAMRLLITASVFAGMTAVWCAVGYALVANPLVGAHIQHLGQRVLPYVLIGVGVLVLWHADSVSLVAS